MAKPAQTQWCENCRWWGAERAHDHNMPLGSCRRSTPSVHAPQVLAYHDPDRPEVAGPVIARGGWLWTAFDDWCGDFKNRSSKGRA